MVQPIKWLKFLSSATLFLFSISILSCGDQVPKPDVPKVGIQPPEVPEDKKDHEKYCPATDPRLLKTCGCQPEYEQFSAIIEAAGINEKIVTEIFKCVGVDIGIDIQFIDIGAKLKGCSEKRTDNDDQLVQIVDDMIKRFQESDQSVQKDVWLKCYQNFYQCGEKTCGSSPPYKTDKKISAKVVDANNPNGGECKWQHTSIEVHKGDRILLQTSNKQKWSFDATHFCTSEGYSDDFIIKYDPDVANSRKVVNESPIGSMVVSVGSEFRTVKHCTDFVTPHDGEINFAFNDLVPSIKYPEPCHDNSGSIDVRISVFPEGMILPKSLCN